MLPPTEVSNPASEPRPITPAPTILPDVSSANPEAYARALFGVV